MDSANSGSLHSSSSGDADITASTLFNHIPILQPSSNFYNPSSFSPNPNPNPNSVYNLDSLWSRTSNSNPIYDYLNPNPDPSPNPVDDDHLNPDSAHEKLGVTSKNPKKRTRASRRAPTTVLTTDTTNFRQMVQEFTGIPAAPFAGSPSSSAFTRRIDYYGGGMNPVRPSAQKLQLPLPLQLQQTSYLNSGNGTTSGFHLPVSETHGITKQPLNLSGLQNQMFPFQSVSQVNATETSNALPSLKRWRGQDENLVYFEGVNGNSQNDVVSSRIDGDHTDQLPGNEDSWSF